MTGRTHHVIQHKSAVPGIEAMTLLTDRAFPRHAHDHLGIGVMTGGAQRSWSGIGPVESQAGDVVTVNPGEMHDGLPIQGQARGWRMLYLDPALVAHEVRGDLAGEAEMARPALRDPVLAGHFARAFAQLTATAPDRLAVEEALLRCLLHALGRHGARRQALGGPPHSIARARRRLDDAPELPVTLAELAMLEGVSRYQLLRAFSRETGATPHAYLMQQRVRLARRHLASGTGVADAAAQAGFADQSHLTRAFVRQLGVTPGRYRAAVA